MEPPRTRDTSPASDDIRHPNKIRRVSRACLQCRSRKQRCMPAPTDSGPRAPCRRCGQFQITCSFETEQPVPADAVASPSRLAQLVVDLERRVNSQEVRLAQLEDRSNDYTSSSIQRPAARSPLSLRSTSESVYNNEREVAADSTATAPSAQTAGFNLDTVEIRAPIATLRSLRATAGADDSNTQPSRSGLAVSTRSGRDSLDPITNGILSESEAVEAIGIYFDHCHRMAPFLDLGLRFNLLELRASRQALLLALCYIGARFWPMRHNDPASPRGLHPRSHELTALLDSAISRLLLRPSTTDVNMDSIRVLLLYIQWMPFDHDAQQAVNGNTGYEMSRRHRSRYSDISAWSVLGLAVRYSVILDLERSAIGRLHKDSRSISAADMSQIRLWRNLVTCDCNLMLSSGLPMSLDPLAAAKIGHRFASHAAAQQPGDLRVTALVELAVIVHRATQNRNSAAEQDASSASRLRRFNMEMDEWEREWVARLRHRESQHTSLPFTSMRWYRLALNSASVSTLLSSQRSTGEQRPVQLEVLQSLDVSLKAASHTWYALSERGADLLWQYDAARPLEMGSTPLVIDKAAARGLVYAVDSTWISHTFAIIFLILCYIRGLVDDELKICSLCPPASLGTCAPRLPSQTSLLYRLVQVALAVYAEVCTTPSSHPAHDFQVVVQNAASLVLGPSDAEVSSDFALDDMADQSLYDLMLESGVEWPGNFFGPEMDMGAGWGDPAPFNM